MRPATKRAASPLPNRRKAPGKGTGVGGSRVTSCVFRRGPAIRVLIVVRVVIRARVTRQRRGRSARSATAASDTARARRTANRRNVKRRSAALRRWPIARTAGVEAPIQQHELARPRTDPTRLGGQQNGFAIRREQDGRRHHRDTGARHIHDAEAQGLQHRSVEAAATAFEKDLHRRRDERIGKTGRGPSCVSGWDARRPPIGGRVTETGTAEPEGVRGSKVAAQFADRGRSSSHGERRGNPKTDNQQNTQDLGHHRTSKQPY